MTLATDQEPGEEQMRNELLKTAPKPSTSHNEFIMQAARARAKATRDARRPKGLFGSRLLSGLAVAASLFVAVVVLMPTLSETPAPTIERSETISVTPADGAALTASPARFEWPEAATSQRYKLSVYNDSAELLWRSDATEALSLAVKEGQELPSGRYFWTVDLVDGPKGRSLGPFWFRVK